MAIFAESFCKNQFYSYFRQTQLCRTRKMIPGGNFARFFQLWPPKKQNRPPNGYSCRIILQKSILFFFATNTAVQDPWFAILTTKKSKSAKRLFLQNHSAKINFYSFFRQTHARPGKWPQGVILPPFCNYDHQKIKIDRQMAIFAESFCKNQFYSYFRQTQLCRSRKMIPGGNFARFFQLWPPKKQNRPQKSILFLFSKRKMIPGGNFARPKKQNRPPNGYSCRIILQKSILFFFSTNTAVQDPGNDPRG